MHNGKRCLNKTACIKECPLQPYHFTERYSSLRINIIYCDHKATTSWANTAAYCLHHSKTKQICAAIKKDNGHMTYTTCPCNTHATLMQHSCNTHATLMQHSCNTHATLMQHSCNTHATLMQHSCNTHATLQYKVKKYKVKNPCCNWGANRPNSRLYLQACNKCQTIDENMGDMKAREPSFSVSSTLHHISYSA